MDLRFENLGEQELKNIARPVQAFSIDLTSTSERRPTEATPLPLPDKPSIAVLPFDNMSGDPEQEYFADGLTEDIITALSHWRSFPVIARNSTFTYKRQAVDVRKVADELGARYVVEGGVRKSGNRVRVSAQLIDASTGHHVWAENFDRTLEDIFELQDEITHQIAAAVAPELERAEQSRLKMKRTESFSAWEYYLRGMSLIHEMPKGGNAGAREMFTRAIELDPSYSDAYCGIAYSHQQDLNRMVADDREKAIERLLESGRKAVELDPVSSTAHANLGIAYQFSRMNDQAIAEGQAAVDMNPSSALAHVVLGVSFALVGKPQEGIPHLERALQLSPQDPWCYQYMSLLSMAHVLARHYEKAEAWARKSILLRDNFPGPHLWLAVALAHMERNEEARVEFEACERYAPGVTKKSFLEKRTPQHSEQIFEALHKVGWKK